jgi:hypothetical protein
MGSPAIAGLVAHAVFWFRLAYGWFRDEVHLVSATIFLSLWVLGWMGLPYFPYGAALFSSYVAALDIALIFMIFKRDVRLS